MELLSLLEAAHSKTQMQKIVDWVGNDQKRFDELVKLFLTSEYRIIQRASWPLSNCAVNNPQFIKKHFKELIRHMKDAKQHSAVRRNVLRIFNHIDLPEKLHGELMSLCIAYIEDPNEAIAVQAHSLGILTKLTKLYPEIRAEVQLIINSRLPRATAAFKSRAKKY